MTATGTISSSLPILAQLVILYPPEVTTRRAPLLRSPRQVTEELRARRSPFWLGDGVEASKPTAPAREL